MARRGRFACILLLIAVLSGCAQAEPAVFAPQTVSISLTEYTGGLRNPLKGMRGQNTYGHEISSLYKWYTKWSDIESAAADGADKLRAYSDEQWAFAPGDNTKIIPRVYLQWPYRENEPDNGLYWPSDMETGDYDSPAFRERLTAMIEKMGAAWDNDPRVAYIEMGLIGFWGEQHSPEPSPEVITLLIETFERCFRNKPVMVRYPKSPLFAETDYGLYWDEWGSEKQWAEWDLIFLVLTEPYADRWKTAVFGGENTNNTYGFEQPGPSFMTYGIRDPFPPEEGFETKLDVMINYARLTHTNHVGTPYPADGAKLAVANMHKFQNTLGYHFVLGGAAYTDSAMPGGVFDLSFTVTNTGASPFYAEWPVQAALLDPQTKKPVWTEILDTARVKDWMPGERWNASGGVYTVPPLTHTAGASLHLPEDIKPGTYLLALSILDPAGLLPAAVFANESYIQGGYTVLGAFGVGQAPAKINVKYDNPGKDKTLRYCVNLSAGAVCDTAPALTDGASDTAYTVTGAQTLAIDLGGKHDLRSLEICGDAPAFTTETSPDGINWTAHTLRLIPADGMVRAALAERGVRYVRFTFPPGTEAELREIVVYGE